MAIFLHTKYTVSVPVPQVTVNSFKTHISLMSDSCSLQDVHLVDLFAAPGDASRVSLKNVVFYLGIDDGKSPKKGDCFRTQFTKVKDTSK